MTVSKAYAKMMSEGKLEDIDEKVRRKGGLGPGIGADPEMRLRDLEDRMDKLEKIIKKLG
jgi:hypothetical protein